MEYVIVIIIAYLIGTISPAMITARRVKKIDIRDVNSKNAGTSNIAITLGMKYAVIVGLSDILKGAIPVVILRLIFPDNEIIWIVGGLSAVLGHIYPVFYGFRGGKGTATFGGMILAVFPIQALVLALFFFIVLMLSDFITIATVAVMIAIPIMMVIQSNELISIILVTSFSVFSIFLHRKNIIRIINKEELGLRKGVSKRHYER